MENDPKEVFSKLISERKFGDVILFGWFTVELIVNLLLLNEYKLLPFDEKNEKQKFLINNMDIDFDKKYRFLKSQKTFTSDEVSKIDEFRTMRNKLSHANVNDFMENFFDEKQQEKLMKLAVDATYSALGAYHRKFGK